MFRFLEAVKSPEGDLRYRNLMDDISSWFIQDEKTEKKRLLRRDVFAMGKVISEIFAHSQSKELVRPLTQKMTAFWWQDRISGSSALEELNQIFSSSADLDKRLNTHF